MEISSAIRDLNILVISSVVYLFRTASATAGNVPAKDEMCCSTIHMVTKRQLAILSSAPNVKAMYPILSQTCGPAFCAASRDAESMRHDDAPLAGLIAGSPAMLSKLSLSAVSS